MEAAGLNGPVCEESAPGAARVPDETADVASEARRYVAKKVDDITRRYVLKCGLGSDVASRHQAITRQKLMVQI